jgi:hypothetical protein
MKNEWRIDISYANAANFKKFRGRYPREYASCFSNLDTILNRLNLEIPLSVLANNPPFFKPEKGGLFRIGQKGVVAAKETRLYVYPDEQLAMVFVVDIGTKETQKQDIAASLRVMHQIRDDHAQ